MELDFMSQAHKSAKRDYLARDDNDNRLYKYLA